MVAGGCWIRGNARDAIGGVNTGVRGRPNQTLLVLGGGVKVVTGGLGGGAGLVLLLGRIASSAAHREEEVIVYVVFWFVLRHPDGLGLLELDHFYHTLVPDLCTVMTDGGSE